MFDLHYKTQRIVCALHVAVELTSKNKAAALRCLHTQTNITVNFKSFARMMIKDTDVVTLMHRTAIFYASAYPSVHP